MAIIGKSSTHLPLWVWDSSKKALRRLLVCSVIPRQRGRKKNTSHSLKSHLSRNFCYFLVYILTLNQMFGKRKQNQNVVGDKSTLICFYSEIVCRSNWMVKVVLTECKCHSLLFTDHALFCASGNNLLATTDVFIINHTKASTLSMALWWKKSAWGSREGALPTDQITCQWDWK